MGVQLGLGKAGGVTGMVGVFSGKGGDDHPLSLYYLRVGVSQAPRPIFLMSFFCVFFVTYMAIYDPSR